MVFFAWRSRAPVIETTIGIGRSCADSAQAHVTGLYMNGPSPMTNTTSLSFHASLVPQT